MRNLTPMHERIIAATLDCMREHGVRATTTRMIARQAGVSEGSIYNHFSSRSELIVSAFGAATEQIRTRAEDLTNLVGHDTVAANLTSLAVAVIDFFRELNPIVGSILGDPELKSWFTDGTVVADTNGKALSPLTGVSEVAGYLEREHDAGRIPDRGPWPVVAAMLIGACQQYVYLEALSPGGIRDVAPERPWSPAEYAREIVRTLLGDPV